MDRSGCGGDHFEWATRSQSGRIIDETIDGVDPYTAGSNFTYDTAGRLTSARAAGGGFYEYGFAATGGCGANPAAGANSNRTTARVNSTTVATYCYDNADRLTSVVASTAPHSTYAGAIEYDTRGNTTTIGGEELVYDGTDRHMATYAPNAVTPRSSVVYQRDLGDRLIARTSTVVSTITHRDTQTQTSGAATATSITVTKPVGTLAGDVLVAAVVADGGTGVTVTAPAGWTLARPAQDQTTLIRTVVWTKTAGATEPASYVFTLSVARKVTASVSAYTGVDPVTPVDVTAGVSSATAATVLNAPSVTTTGTYRQLVGVYGTRIAATFTPAAGVTERADRQSTGAGAVTINVTDRPLTTTGATGTTTTTATTAGVSALITVALRPLVTVESHRYVNSGVTSAVATTAGAVIERTIPLPGAVIVTKRATGDVWSYPNIHGDVQATANTAGVKQGATYTYDPYGTTLAGTVDNMAGGIDNGWLGQHQRPLEHTTGLNPVIEMGARPYNPVLGRFTRVDPGEGGSCNDYDYTNADPVGSVDLDGLKPGQTVSTYRTVYVRRTGWLAEGLQFYSRWPSVSCESQGGWA